VRVVIDPNVLLSALIAPGGTSDLTVRAVVARATLIVSPHMLDPFVQRSGEERLRLSRGPWNLRWGSSTRSVSCETLRETTKSHGRTPNGRFAHIHVR
jgi:hypothetical protein